MFEITGDDIALLNDEDLRSLVGLLCESDLRSRGLPTSSVTWGGNQTAADAGLDVRVALPTDSVIAGFVPRPATGFQVKKRDMPRNAILEEMRPSGVIRPVIQELADQSGAYIIVSSIGSTSDLALGNRRVAMAEGVADVKNAGALTLDFYDRTRIAIWVRDHAGLIPWVREKIGKSIQGWRSYGAWSGDPDGVSGEYLLDEKLRIHTGKKESSDGVQVKEGIKRIRDLLREPGKIIRLVGLSGVGKTRFVQALFDDRISEQCLDPSFAIYTNMADDPDPQPTGLASDLIAARTRAILVVDNCPPDLHRRLSELCRSQGSTVSVVTVEYDIREDEPEGTEVFSMESSSIQLIEKLVKQRFTELSVIDARTAAEFSGGNARIAIALAGTIGKNETIKGLTDEDLFRRLFQQRHEPDESLLLVAQACSLVYSFQGEDISSADAELPRLGALIGKSAQEIFLKVAELRRRDLVQQRRVWRAVLPHAIANRLATIALQNIPIATIEAQLIHGAPERMLKSFSRRLGYLDNSREATKIVERWLSPGGLLSDVVNLDNLAKAMFDNVAPVAPEAVLGALEGALRNLEDKETLSRCKNYIRLIRSLAYDALSFERCVALILKFAGLEDDNDKSSNEATNIFSSLFFLYLSGTHATIEQRLKIIEALLVSENVKQQEMGLKALGAALEAWHFMSGNTFEFGARSRDHGYWPRSGAEVWHWYSSVLKLVETLACSDRAVASQVRVELADKFRGIWTMAGMYGDLERVSCAISTKQFWREGWIAVRSTHRYDSESLKPEIAARLSSLEKMLRPKDLLQKARSIVLSRHMDDLDIDDFEDESIKDPVNRYDRAEAIARSLGKRVSADEHVFKSLLAELVSGEGRLYSFGQGLAENENPKAIWDALIAQLAITVKSAQNIQVLRGFLNILNERNLALADAFFEDALQSDTLASWYPALQTSVAIDKGGVNRLKRSVALGKAPMGMYHNLSMGRSTDPIFGHDLKELLLSIAAKPDGFDVAIDILAMRLFSEKQHKHGLDAEITDTGRQLLQQLTFGKSHKQEDHDLGVVVKSCLAGKDGAPIAQEVCRKFKEAISRHQIHVYENNGLLKGLLEAQPGAVLDALFGGDEKEQKNGIHIVEHNSQMHPNLLDVVPQEVLLSWCDRDKEAHYPIAAATVAAFWRPKENAALQWTDLALRLLEKAPNRIAVLKQFTRRFRPMSWSGSRAAIMESNMKLLDDLGTFPDVAVTEFITQEKIRLGREIESERRSETESDRATDERFE